MALAIKLSVAINLGDLDFVVFVPLLAAKLLGFHVPHIGTPLLQSLAITPPDDCQALPVFPP